MVFFRRSIELIEIKFNLRRVQRQTKKKNTENYVSVFTHL